VKEEKNFFSKFKLHQNKNLKINRLKKSIKKLLKENIKKIKNPLSLKKYRLMGLKRLCLNSITNLHQL
jgi:hypothetical protein